ncbi:MAG: pyridoxamine 5'-phosphate oxidase [Pseudomonadota bacterium]
MTSLKMSQEEREAFLADVHVGIISIEQPGRSPLTVPIWYDYTPGGEVEIVTGVGSIKEKLLSQAGRFSLCAQSEAMPYKYVSVEGPVTSSGAAGMEQDLKPMAIRYLGEEMGNQYAAGSNIEGNLLIKMKPERWLTVDYAKQFS